MRVSDLSWSDLERLIENQPKCVVPLGCTEQHAGLSLSTDSILAEKVALDAAAELEVPVFPVLAYGITPSFKAYPGSVSLRVSTYAAILKDVLDCLAVQGLKKVVFVNGHGGNIPGASVVEEWLSENAGRGLQIRWHNWWCAPETWSTVQSIDPNASHASWMENFPWTRLVDETDLPEKPMVDSAEFKGMGPRRVRDLLGDGSFGGKYQRSDDEMDEIWSVAVAETRAIIDSL